MLAISALAACNGDDIDDDSVIENDDESVDEDDPAAVDDDEEATNDEDDDTLGQASDEPEDDADHEVVEETINVTLVDYEIDMAATAENGIVAFALSNEGEAPHGIAIEETTGDDGGELIGAMTADPGETEQVELEPADYAVFCPVGNHREDEGMEIQLTVE